MSLADPARWAAAAGVVAGYAALCAAVWLGQRRQRRAARREADRLGGSGDAPGLLIVHASQTGAAEQLAWEAARVLHASGIASRVIALGALAPAALARHATALFIASTTGEGDAPDAASPFVRRFMAAPVAQGLPGLRFGLLALGDSEFTNFCAFGRRLDAWLRSLGAVPLFDRIEADGLSAEALHRWRHELGHVASLDAAAAVDPNRPPAAFTPRAEAPLMPWRLAARRVLNPDSEGGPVVALDFEAPAGSPVDWMSGDLAQIHVPGLKRPREYSIASVPADGRLQLLVRRAQQGDGTPGAASGWLADGLAVGQPVPIRLLAHGNFRLGDNARRPLILIANGTGLAGLRSHLRARAAAGGAARHWLVFGERHSAVDFHGRDEIENWVRSGVIERLDLAFSRDQPARIYVQDKLREAASTVRAWVDDEAAIYVCGSLEGMATGVDDALAEALGRDRLDDLILAGRYRRDVY